MKSRSTFFLGPLAAAALLAACTSAERKAANDAAVAQGALERGQIAVARRYIQRSLAIRDDVSEYWLLMAHIALADKDLPGAFTAYQNLLQLDRANGEALASLCQIALAGNSAIQAEKYADQLALINPGDTLPNTVRAAAAAARGDKGRANHYLDLVFAVRPGDPTALIVKARMLADGQDYVGAAKLVEQTLTAPGDPSSRLAILSDYYKRARDGDGLFRAVGRLAQTNPTDPAIQLQYADLLFDRGDNAAANAAIVRAAQERPNDIGVAATALNLWLKQGPDAVPRDQLVKDAGNAAPALKAAYAQFASETGHPDLAMLILGKLPVDSASLSRPDVAEAAAALAYARGLTGDRTGAESLIAAVLESDPDQPRALLARGRLRAAAGDRRGAIEDVRRVVAEDGNNIAARLTLAELLYSNGDAVLAETALRDGMKAAGDDPRLARRLARLLIAEGRPSSAATTIADFIRMNPIGLRASRPQAQ